MRRLLILAIAVLVIVRVAASDAKEARPVQRAAPRSAEVAEHRHRIQPPPVLEVQVDDEAEPPPEEEPEEPIDEREAVDVEVALDVARIAATTTSGAIQGIMRAAATQEILPGVTIVVTSPSMQGSQAAITDENGFFRITDLPGGPYLVTAYYDAITIEYADVSVQAGKTTPFFQMIDTEPHRGITIDTDYVRIIPIPERTFESEPGEAISFSGIESSHNVYIVEEIVPHPDLVFGDPNE